MKFQLKALVVALSFAAVSVSANAATAPTATGNGSLILTLINSASNVAAAFDLGKNYADFNQFASAGAVTNVTDKGTVFSWNLSQGDYSLAWNAFTTAAGSNLGTTQWAVYAGDNLGTGAGTRGYLTSYVSAGSLSGNQLITSLGNHDAFVADINFKGNQNGTSNLATADNGGASNALAGLATFYSNSKNFGTGPNVLSLIGNEASVAQYVIPATSLQQASINLFTNNAKFALNANGSFTYMTAPIPEADTWAMMVAGLGLMGFVVRRRSRQA